MSCTIQNHLPGKYALRKHLKWPELAIGQSDWRQLNAVVYTQLGLVT